MNGTSEHYQIVSVSETGYSIVKRNGLFGILDPNQKLIIECKYKALKFVFEDKCIVKEFSDWSFIDITTKQKDYLYIDDFEDNNTIIIFDYNKTYDDDYEDWDFYDIGNMSKEELEAIFGEIKEVEVDDIEIKITDKQPNYTFLDEIQQYSVQVILGRLEGILFQTGLFLEDGNLKAFNNGIAKAYRGDKWGCINIKGETIIPFQYQEIEEFVDGIAKAKRDNEWGIIDESGNELVNNEIKLSNDLIKGDVFGKYGIRTKEDDIIMHYEFEMIGEFINGKAKAKKDGQCGIVNEFGSVIISFKYLDIGEFINGKAKAHPIYSLTERGWGVIDEQENVIIPFEYKYIGDFVDGKTLASKYHNSKIRKHKGKQDEIYGYIDESGKTIIAFQYEYLGGFIDGLALASKTIETQTSKYEIVYGFIDEHDRTVIPFEFQELEEFVNGLAIAKKKHKSSSIRNWGDAEKWGCINKQGDIVIPFEYDAVDIFDNGLIKAKKGYKYGCLDQQGNTIIPFDFDDIQQSSNKLFVKAQYHFGNWGTFDTKGNVVETQIGLSNGMIKIERAGKYGLLSEKNEIIILCEYEQIEDFINGKAKAKKDGCWGIINYQGSIVIPFEYDWIDEFVEGKAKVRLYTKVGIIDDQGNIIIEDEVEIQGGLFQGKKLGKYGIRNIKNQIIVPYEYEEIGEFINNIARVSSGWITKWGYINIQGEIVIPCIYEGIDYFNNGKVKACVNEDKNSYLYYERDKHVKLFGILDKDANILIPFEYHEIKEFHNGKAIARKNAYWGIIDEKGNTMVPFLYDIIEEFINGRAKAKKNSKWGIINEDGVAIIPFEYDEIGDFSKGQAKARIYCGLWGIIDEKGNTIIEDEIELQNGLIQGKKFGQHGIRTKDNQLIIPYEYDKINEFINGRAKAKKNSKWGVIDEKGNIIIPFQYDQIEDFVKGKANVKKHHKWGLIDELGNELVYNEFELPNGLIKGDIFGKYGIRTKQNKILFPYEHEEIQNFIDGLAKAKRNSKWGIINEKGKIIVPFEFKEIGDFINGLTHAIKDYEYDNWEDYNSDNTRDWGIIDKKGNVKIEDEIELSNGLMKGRRFRHFGLRSKDNKVIIPYEYDEIEVFTDNLIKVSKNSHWGLIDYEENLVSPFEYNEIGKYREGKARVSKKNITIGQGWGRKKKPDQIEILYGYINEKAELIIPMEYDFIDFFVNGRARAKKKGKWGVIDESGNIVLDFIYDGLSNFLDGVAIVIVNGKWGCIDENGSIVVPYQYDAISGFKNGLAKVRLGSGKEFQKNGQKAPNYFNYIDSKGKVLFTPFLYRIGWFLNHHTVAVMRDKNGIEKYGCINDKGKIVIPFEYDGLSYFHDTFAIAKLGDTYFKMGKNGKKTALNKNETIEESFFYENDDNTGNKIPVWIYMDTSKPKDGIGFNILSKWGTKELEIQNNFIFETDYLQVSPADEDDLPKIKIPEWWDGNDIDDYMAWLERE